MNFKSILLGTAAGLMGVSAAAAADLPGETVPTAVEYVKVCDTFGAGFFYIPGTETCLDISGRVRFRVEYRSADLAAPAGALIDEYNVDTLRFRADARVDFDARTATEYGNLRTFIRLGDELNEAFEDNGLSQDVNDKIAGIKLAFIQLGYLTVGLHGDVANGDVLYGDNSFGYFTGDSDLVGITVFADDLGGGFYAGAGIYSSRGGRDNIIWGEDDFDDYADISLQGAIGIAGQPWGSVDLSGVYEIHDRYLGYGTLGDVWSIKGTADLILSDAFNARLVAAYKDNTEIDDEVFTLAGALSYGFSDAATVYAGIRYDIADGDDLLGANIGVDYTIVPDLILTGEVSYADRGDDEALVGLIQLTRNW